MNKNTTITVAIPAFNEEKTIVDLIHSVKEQEPLNFLLERICVYSDGSTDKTVSLIKRKFKDVEVNDFKYNRGKTVMLNKILSSNNSDLLILLDADTKFRDSNVFKELVKVFKKEKNVGIVCAYHRFLPNKSLVGKISYFGFKIWDSARNSLGNKGIRYYCEGGLLAISRDFAKHIRYPQKYHVGDDSYSFYYAVTNNFKVLLAKKAVVCFDLPKNYKDYAKQMKRFLTDGEMISTTFGKNLVAKYEIMSRKIKLKAFIKKFRKDPLLGIGYVALQLSTKVQMPFFRPKVGWSHIDRS